MGKASPPASVTTVDHLVDASLHVRLSFLITTTIQLSLLIRPLTLLLISSVICCGCIPALRLLHLKTIPILLSQRILSMGLVLPCPFFVYSNCRMQRILSIHHGVVHLGSTQVWLQIYGMASLSPIASSITILEDMLFPLA